MCWNTCIEFDVAQVYLVRAKASENEIGENVPRDGGLRSQRQSQTRPERLRVTIKVAQVPILSLTIYYLLLTLHRSCQHRKRDGEDDSGSRKERNRSQRGSRLAIVSSGAFRRSTTVGAGCRCEG